LGSVVVRSADPGRVRQAVEALARDLRAAHAEVERIVWFGSWVTGIPTPGSDVDLCLVLAESDKPFRDRIPDYLPVGFPVGLDLFPYTRAEFERLQTTFPEWYRAITGGREV